MGSIHFTDADLVTIADARNAGASWPAIAADMPGDADGDTVRKRYYRAVDRGHVARAIEASKREAPVPAITGTRAEELVDRVALWSAAEARFELQRQAAIEASAKVQRIRFDEGPICMVYIGDLHCGGAGVDYKLAREHVQLVRDTPGMYLNVMGDLVDNFIHQWAIKIRLGTETTIPQEWHLVRQWLEWGAPKLTTAVDGNHDAWTVALAGIDYYRDVIANARPDALYARDDLRFILDVGGAEWSVAHRHKWKGYSIYNATHGQERSQKWDQDFRVAVGAHTHTGAFFRTFNAGGVEGLAIQVNTYKVLDQYPRQENFPKSTLNKPVAVIYRDDGQVVGSTSLELAADMMRLYYRGKKRAA